LRVLYVGMVNAFSGPPLEALLAAGQDVVGVMVPQTRTQDDAPPVRQIAPARQAGQLPVLGAIPDQTIVGLARRLSIPVYAVNQLDARETLERVSALRPDVGCVACFPFRIPGVLLALPGHGFLNLHPSLLPAYRGPNPLFWSLRDGVTETGVTVHFMDANLDTGDIAAQAPLALPDGISGRAADLLAARLGGRLMVEVLQALERGDLTRRPQPAGVENYHPAPSSEDFVMNTAWSARRAFNFMRGTIEWGQAYSIDIGGERLTLQSAIAFEAEERLDAPYRHLGRDILIRFTPGVLRARLSNR
jgi:methionyl-tRNA formyltransferase